MKHLRLVVLIGMMASWGWPGVAVLRASSSKVRLDRPVFTLTYEASSEWQDAARLQSTLKLSKDSTGEVKCLFFVNTYQNWRYQTPATIHLTPGRKTAIDLSFSEKDHQWIPAGHYRTWDAFARLNMRSFGIKIFSQGNNDLLEIDTLRPKGKLKPAQPRSLILFDSTWICAPLHDAGNMCEYSFRLNRNWQNPFDPQEVAIDAVFETSNSPSIIRPAFFAQDYVPSHVQDDGHLVPIGPSSWRVRFVPPAPGAYQMSLVIASDNEKERLTCPPFIVAKQENKDDPTKETRTSKFLVPVKPGPRFQLTDTTWQQTIDLPNDTLAWRVPLEWREGWGTYRGEGWINLEAAHHLDKAMQAQKARPFLLNTAEEFGEQGIYRWPDHPLNKDKGGYLTGPSFQYENIQAQQAFERQFRYAIARWGHHPAVSDFFLGATAPAPHASEWHGAMAQFLAGLGIVEKRFFSLHPEAQTRAYVTLADFEKRKVYPWRAEGRLSPSSKLKKSSSIATHGNGALAIQAKYPGEGAFYRILDGSWTAFDTLSLDLFVPKEAPPYMRVMVFLRDHEGWWYEALLPETLRNSDWNRLLVPVRSGIAWTPRGHSRPWTDYSLQRVRALGIRIFGNTAYTGRVYVDNIRLLKQKDPDSQPLNQFTRWEPTSETVAVYGRYEVSFDLARIYDNPFDPAEVDIQARFISPSGKIQDVGGFFYQDYERKLLEDDKLLRSRGKYKVIPKCEHLIPKGPPCWKVRFTPTEPGAYNYTLIVKDPHGTLKREGTFHAAAGEGKGFVRRSRLNPFFFEFDDGDFYYPIGYNLRSPSDSRIPYPYPFALPGKMGTYIYDDYFVRMQENGLNWARIWMCAWWCGLEWRRDWPGFQGVGRYNMENAWRLDYLVTQAEARGIYIQLCTTNHGQYSSRVDKEWANNPYNHTLGGPSQSASDLFTKPYPKAKLKDRLRYTIARWGASPAVMSWGILSEVEFTELYDRKTNRGRDQGRTVPEMAAWHKEMAEYIRSIDPWKHLITTHFSHPNFGREVWQGSGLDYSQSNAYSVFRELGNKGPVHAIDMYISRFMGKFSRLPVLIGEYGGHWANNTSEQLDVELHCGLWGSLTQPRLAGNTGFWWWLHVHYQNGYKHYRALANFMAGEDLRRPAFHTSSIKVSSPRNVLKVRGIDNGSRALLWVYHPQIERTLVGVPAVQKGELALKNMLEGEYQVEFWDTYKGKIIQTQNISTQHRTLVISLPIIRNDLAIKARIPDLGVMTDKTTNNAG